jgi:hypothetical protein
MIGCKTIIIRREARAMAAFQVCLVSIAFKCYHSAYKIYLSGSYDV